MNNGHYESNTIGEADKNLYPHAIVGALFVLLAVFIIYKVSQWFLIP